jgi:uncharacterized membrane protein (UPF0182 family)
MEYLLSVIFIVSLVVSRIVAEYVTGWVKSIKTTGIGFQRPPTIRSIPVLGSLPFLPVFEKWHTFFTMKSAENGNVQGLYLGKWYTIYQLLNIFFAVLYWSKLYEPEIITAATDSSFGLLSHTFPGC